AFAIAGLHAEGVTTIEGTECISTSYPGFERDLNRFLQASTTEPSIPVLARMPRGMGIETLSAEDAE
ncbi:MAG: 3-phosphoshikimate 1-carboxyvinyltransferase, partial [Verrucomicrobiaceae bacterium]|nr:3-phosphoshikimate 1-carboxyvinyltransferase [Verrucomicrobiaceae bacterium]